MLISNVYYNGVYVDVFTCWIILWSFNLDILCFWADCFWLVCLIAVDWCFRVTLMFCFDAMILFRVLVDYFRLSVGELFVGSLRLADLCLVFPGFVFWCLGRCFCDCLLTIADLLVVIVFDYVFTGACPTGWIGLYLLVIVLYCCLNVFVTTSLTCDL